MSTYSLKKLKKLVEQTNVWDCFFGLFKQHLHQHLDLSLYVLSQRIHLVGTHLQSGGPEGRWASSIPLYSADAFTMWKWLVLLNVCTNHSYMHIHAQKNLQMIGIFNLPGGLQVDSIKTQCYYNLLSIGSRLGIEVCCSGFRFASYWVSLGVRVYLSWSCEFWVSLGMHVSGVGAVQRWCTKDSSREL